MSDYFLVLLAGLNAESSTVSFSAMHNDNHTQALLRNTMLDARCVQFGPGGKLLLPWSFDTNTYTALTYTRTNSTACLIIRYLFI